MNYFFEGLVLESKRRDLGAGLEAAIRLYYENYSDALELDREFIQTLEQLVEHTLASIDVEDLVTETEAKINHEGGIKRENGKRHYVRTYPYPTCSDCDHEVDWPGQTCTECRK
jgi:hypothetical protein